MIKISYNINLGRVKGDTGTSYIPSIVIQNGKQYIKYTSSDNTPLPDVLQGLHPFNSKFYEPSLSPDGNSLVFSLQSNVSDTITLSNVKGAPGRNLINIKVVENVPNVASLTDSDKNIIYLLKDNNNNTALEAAIYDETTNDFIYLDIASMISFDTYLTNEDAYNKEETYNKNEINDLLGYLENRINDINDIMRNEDDVSLNNE